MGRKRKGLFPTTPERSLVVKEGGCGCTERGNSSGASYIKSLLKGNWTLGVAATTSIGPFLEVEASIAA